MSGVNPQSTTARLAGDVSKEPSSGQAPTLGSPNLPGAFPATPADETTGFSINPIPETPGIGNPINLAPGEKVPDPSTLTSNTVSSTVRDDTSLIKKPDEPEQTFGISPLPATSGIGNPIQLAPGEKVPPSNTFTPNTIDTFVTTDEASFNRGSGPPQLPEVVTPQSERDNRGASLFNLPPISGSMIPESSLPIFGGASNEAQDPGVTIQSAGPNSTTAALAGQVPLEPRGVAEVIPRDEAPVNQERDSLPRDQISGSKPSTGASARHISTEPRSDETSSQGRNPDVNIQSVGRSSTTAKLAGEVPLEPRGSPRDTPDSGQGVDDLKRDKLDDVTIQSVGANSTTAGLAGDVPLERRIPPGGPPENQKPFGDDRKRGRLDDVTIQSVGANATTAGLAGNVPLEPRSPPREISENQKPFGDNEGTRLDDVTTQSVGANATTAGLAGNVPLEPRSSSGNIAQDPQGGGGAKGDRFDGVTIQSAGANATTADLAGNVPLEPRGVPEIVSDSQQKAGFPPEASANLEALGEKAAVEEELERKVPEKPADSVGIGHGTIAEAAPAGKTSAGGISSSPSHTLPASVQQSIDEINRGSAGQQSFGDHEGRARPGGFTIQSTGANATTTGLAGQVPLEPRRSLNTTTSGVTPGSTGEGKEGIAIAPTVPDVVQKSIALANQSPEAAASAVAVEEKKAVQSELLSHVKVEEAVGQPAPSASAALSTQAPAPTSSITKDAGKEDFSAADPSPRVPAKSAMEEALQQRHDSRDISPMSHPIGGGQSAQADPPATLETNPQGLRATAPPTNRSATAGVTPSSTPQKRADPIRASSSAKSPQASSEASASSDKKSRRASGFFGKLKSKFSHKD